MMSVLPIVSPINHHNVPRFSGNLGFFLPEKPGVREIFRFPEKHRLRFRIFGNYMIGVGSQPVAKAKTCRPIGGFALSIRRPLECCGVERKAREKTLLLSRFSHFDGEILFEAYCPRCKHALMAVCSFTWVAGRGPLHHIKRKEQGFWLDRKKRFFERTLEKKTKSEKATAAMVYVGDYTMRISRGIIEPDLDSEFEESLPKACVPKTL